MKNKFLVIAILIFSLFELKGIADPSSGILPHFRIGLTNRQYFNETQLKHGKALLIIYFQPDCDDCLAFMKVFFKNESYLKDMQIVMITNESLPQLVNFEKAFNLAKYPNIIAGTEGWTATFQRQFNIDSFPFLAIYDGKERNLGIIRNQKDPKLIIDQLFAACKIKKNR